MTRPGPRARTGAVDGRTLHPSWLTRRLSSLVTKTTYGMGLRSPDAMQYAIELTGFWRILLAAAIHPFGRLMGRRGWFYRVAGLDARMMDAEHTMGIKQFYECVIPAPAHPHWNRPTAEGRDRLRRCDLLERSFGDNPLGQRDEQTPIGIWLEVATTP